MRAHAWFADSIEATGNSLGLPPMTHAQTLLLGHIVRGERRPARLARSMAMSRGSVSLLVSQFVEDGVLTLKPDPSNARAQLVDFAPSSRERAAVVLQIVEQLELRLAELLGPDRLATLRYAFAQDWGEPVKLDAKAAGIAGLAARGRKPRKG